MAPKKGKKAASVDDSQPTYDQSPEAVEERRDRYHLKIARAQIAKLEKKMADRAPNKSDAPANTPKGQMMATRSSKIPTYLPAEKNLTPYTAADVTNAIAGRTRRPKETPRNSRASPLLIEDDRIVEELPDSDDSEASSALESPTPRPKGKKIAAPAKGNGKATKVVLDDSADELVKPVKSPGSSRKTTNKRASRHDERWVKRVLTPRKTICKRCHNDFSKFPALTCMLVASKCTDCMSKSQPCEEVSFLFLILLPC